MRFWLGAWGQAKDAFLRTQKTQSLLQGSAASLGMGGISLGIRLLSGVVLARLLGASSYGIYAYALAWLALLTIPTTLGFDQITLRYVSAYKETQAWPALAGLLRFVFTVAAATAVGVCLVSMVIVALLPEIEWEFQVTMWIVLAILPMAVLTQIRQSSLRGLDHPVLAQIPESIVAPGLLITFLAGLHFLAGTMLTAPMAAAANAAAWLITFAIGTVFLMRTLPKPARTAQPIYDKSRWMEMVLPIVFSGGAYYFMSRGDLLVLGALGTTRDVGLYAAASRAAEQLMMFMYTAATFAGTSLFAQIYATGDMRELQRFARLTARLILLISAPVYIVLMAIAPWVLGLFGQEFIEASSAMRFLLTTFFISSLSGNVISMLYMSGHQRDVAVPLMVAAAINVGLSYSLIPSLGMMGAAISSGMTLILLHGTLAIVLYKRVGIVSLPFGVGKAQRVGDSEQTGGQ